MGFCRKYSVNAQMKSFVVVFTFYFYKSVTAMLHIFQLPRKIYSFPNVKYVIVVTSLITEFDQYFQDFVPFERGTNLFSNPFSADVGGLQEDMQLEPIEIQCDDTRSRHLQLPLSEFYRSLEKSRFPQVSRHSKRMLFGSSYIYSMSIIKFLSYDTEQEQTEVRDDTQSPLWCTLHPHRKT